MWNDFGYLRHMSRQQKDLLRSGTPWSLSLHLHPPITLNLIHPTLPSIPNSTQRYLPTCMELQHFAFKKSGTKNSLECRERNVWKMINALYLISPSILVLHSVKMRQVNNRHGGGNAERGLLSAYGILKFMVLDRNFTIENPIQNSA